MIYLDNAATSFPKPEPVYQALDPFARTPLANPGRAGHRMAIAAEKTLDDVRHAAQPVLPRRGARPLDLHAQRHRRPEHGDQGRRSRPGDHVITTDLEHNSISRPLCALEQAGTITLTRIASRDGYVDGRRREGRADARRPRLVAMTHASNVLGTVQPIEAIAPIVREAGALLLVDAAQSAGVVPIDLKATPIDLLAFPGHKALYGPTGTGALYVGPRTDGRIRAWREGGTGGDSSSATQPDDPPLLPRRRHAERAGPRRPARRHRVGSPTAAPTPSASTRSTCFSSVVDWAETSDAWRIAGRWEPSTHVGALSLFVPDSTSPRRTWARSSTSPSTSPSAPASTAPLHPPPTSARSPTAPSASPPARSPPRRKSTASLKPSPRSPPECSENSGRESTVGEIEIRITSPTRERGNKLRGRRETPRPSRGDPLARASGL